MTIRTQSLNSICLVLTLISLLFSACREEDTPDVGQIEYALKNGSETDVAFKVRLATDANATIVKDSIVIKPGEEVVIVKSPEAQEPGQIIERIEIWNSELREKYKDVDLLEYTKQNDRYILTIGLPPLNASEIIRFNTSVHIYLDETTLFGFYPIVDYPRTTTFFRTPDYFKDIFKVQTPTSTPNADFRMVDIFGSTMIAYNTNVYADKTLFIRSTDEGVTWEPLFEFGFSSSDDAFTGTDFISGNTGWLFNYKTVFNGQYANTYATDVYKYGSGGVNMVSTIDDYAVGICKFLDENLGYVIASPSNNVIPPDTHAAFFMKTTDGGTTWSEPVVISDTYRADKIFRLDNGKLIVFLSPSDGLLKHYMVSVDDGQSWQEETVSVTEGIRDLFFLSDGTGYLKTGTVGLWSSENLGEVYKTVDSGATWTKITDEIFGSIIWFYDENIGYLQDLKYGQGQILYVTRDGGSTWKEVLYPYDYLIE